MTKFGRVIFFRQSLQLYGFEINLFVLFMQFSEASYLFVVTIRDVKAAIFESLPLLPLDEIIFA